MQNQEIFKIKNKNFLILLYLTDIQSISALKDAAIEKLRIKVVQFVIPPDLHINVFKFTFEL